MKKKEFSEMVKSIPTKPGVYRFIDESGKVIYVGKAKSLRARLSSYFNLKTGSYNKTRLMVDTASSIEYTVVESEQDALILENTFIKSWQPKYNVSLKDGKTYVYVCIKKEFYPRVFFTRRVIRDGSIYFGPYTSKYKVEQILDLIKKMFPLRTCSLPLTPESIAKGKFKVCLEYHIKNCMGPCQGFESETTYNDKIAQIKNILKGNFAEVKQYLNAEMLAFSENLEFEKAEICRYRLSLFDEYQAKSMVASATIRDVDVFAMHTDNEDAYIQYLKIVNGSLINTFIQEAELNLDQGDEAQVLALTIEKLREKFSSIAPEVIVGQQGIVLNDQTIKITVPIIGDKKKLLELAEKNIQYYLLQKRKESVTTPRENPAMRIMKTLQRDLNMDHLPVRIECFDNSNIQGTNPVSSCVVFKNAKPSKADYRKFKIKTVVGPDDFASMREVVTRRYSRLLEEDAVLPDLVIIDGGKGQLGVANEVFISLGIKDKITLIGIAKRLEEIYFPDDPLPIHINKKSESLKLIQQLRNEAHRFAITYHRHRRSMNFTVSELTTIPGVGKKSSEKLLQHFKSVKRIAALPQEELTKVTGNKIAELVYNFYNKKKDEEE